MKALFVGVIWILIFPGLTPASAEDAAKALLELISSGTDDQIIAALKANPALANAKPEETSPLSRACILNRVSTARVLIENGANPNAMNKNRRPIHYAVEMGRMPLCDMLLRNGADVALKDALGQNAMFYAQSLEMVEYLQTKGVKIEAADNNQTLLHTVSALGLAKKWIELGVPVDARNDWGITPLMCARNQDLCALFLKHGADVNAADTASKGTALHKAAMTGMKENVRLLLDAGAEVDCRNTNGITPLMMINSRSGGGVAIGEMLLNKGASIDAQSKTGSTALHWAVIGKDNEIVRFLIKNKASVDVKDRGGRTPLDAAKMLKLGDIQAELEGALGR